jgi:OOP family OmpA-OmpF porin
MKFLRALYLPVAVLSSIVLLDACKAKKAIQKSEPVAAQEAPAPVEKAPPVAPVTKPAPQPVAEPAKPDYNFSNIQFEFNSGILKTDSYPIMDKAAAAMKMDVTVKFVLNGHASAEGTAAHNMSLSVERANAVKAYLVNAGVSMDNLTAKGFGDTKPIADNSTEAGRVINRRVEIKKQD